MKLTEPPARKLADFAMEEDLVFTPALDIKFSNLKIRASDCSKDSLFIALKGSRADGHNYIKQAYEYGCRNFLVQEVPQIKANCLRVGNTREYLSKLAAYFYAQPSEHLKLIGITGTNGKTSITYFLESVLQQIDRELLRVGTTGHRLGAGKVETLNTTPESHIIQELLWQCQKNGGQHAIMEVSSHSLATFRVMDVAFDAVSFANLSLEHLEFHKDMEDYFKVKKRLFQGQFCKHKKECFRLVNIDDDYGLRLVKELNEEGIGSLTFSMQSPAADYFIESILVDVMTSSFVLNTPDGKKIAIKTWIPGEISILNCGLAAAILDGMGIAENTIKLGIYSLKTIPGRMEWVKTSLKTKVIVDYAHSPSSLEYLLKCLRPICKGKLCLVFGCGGDRAPEKRPIMGRIAEKWADFIYLTNDNPRSEAPGKILAEIAREMSETKYLIEPDRKKAIFRALQAGKADDIIIVAGKGHEKVQIIGKEIIPHDDKKVVEQIADEFNN
ncbi:UDP-N-acetylmuramoyl-L-alanyl-D-glutamate--2,6-diaminopimelate ligase [Candidatus Riflebacteria bacterium]